MTNAYQEWLSWFDCRLNVTYFNTNKKNPSGWDGLNFKLP
jgi:hypothetical protein